MDSLGEIQIKRWNVDQGGVGERPINDPKLGISFRPTEWMSQQTCKKRQRLGCVDPASWLLLAPGGASSRNLAFTISYMSVGLQRVFQYCHRVTLCWTTRLLTSVAWVIPFENVCVLFEKPRRTEKWRYWNTLCRATIVAGKKGSHSAWHNKTLSVLARTAISDSENRPLESTPDTFRRIKPWLTQRRLEM